MSPVSKHEQTVPLQATQCKATGLSSLPEAHSSSVCCREENQKGQASAIGDMQLQQKCVVMVGCLLSPPSLQLPGDLQRACPRPSAPCGAEEEGLPEGQRAS